MKTISTEWLDGLFCNNTTINDNNKAGRRFKIKQVFKTFKGENQFVITESKLSKLFGIYGSYETIHDKKCFERRIPLYFNSMNEAYNYISQL